MIEGMPASSSIAVPTGPRIQRGATSVRKKAMPKLTGTAISMAMTAVVLLFMALAGKSPLFIAFIAVLGFVLYALRPVLQAWLLESTPKNMGGSSIGVLFGAQSLGSSIAPLIGGVIADRYGLGATFYFLAGTIVCANLLIVLMPNMDADKK